MATVSEYTDSINVAINVLEAEYKVVKRKLKKNPVPAKLRLNQLGESIKHLTALQRKIWNGEIKEKN